MTETHLSIGEVLNLLQDEFPDVTISKIRFLESQGLIDPERTPSGYRKFYTPDIERLRWILVQQRENFLPLKVIKERLDASAGIPLDLDQTATNGSTAGVAVDHGPDGAAPTPTVTPDTATGPDTVVDADGTEASNPQVWASMPAGEDPREPQPIWMADLAASKGARSIQAAASLPLDAGPTEVSLTASELCTTAGITIESLRELEQFGLLAGRSYGDDTYYDGDALLIATRSGAFLGHGIEARHLRMFKVSAEREAGFLEQVAMPMLKQRNPEARRQAVLLVEELANLGHDLRAALLRSNLRRHLDRS
ncbi:MAG: MerR family transcriptional regulator [Aquihabitans sp.]